MRIVLVGGAPGSGKSTAAKELLRIAANGRELVQWVDVDSLWLHQPWQVTDVTKRLVENNLIAVIHNAAKAGVDTLVLTWVFQDSDIHTLVKSLAPADVTFTCIQLLLTEVEWRRRFSSESDRPPIDDFFTGRYAAAQSTAADHQIDVSALTSVEVARRIAQLLAL